MDGRFDKEREVKYQHQYQKGYYVENKEKIINRSKSRYQYKPRIEIGYSFLGFEIVDVEVKQAEKKMQGKIFVPMQKLWRRNMDGHAENQENSKKKRNMPKLPSGNR